MRPGQSHIGETHKRLAPAGGRSRSYSPAEVMSEYETAAISAILAFTSFPSVTVEANPRPTTAVCPEQTSGLSFS